MICVNCNNSITRQDTICPNCQARTGIQTIGMLYSSIVLSILGVILGFGPTFYWSQILSGSVNSPTTNFSDGINMFVAGIFITFIGAALGVVGLVFLVISLTQKRYRRAR